MSGPEARIPNEPFSISQPAEVGADNVCPMKTKSFRALVFDDDQPVGALIACMLISKGLQVIQAGGGEKGIHLTVKPNPFLVLSDICVMKFVLAHLPDLRP